MHPLMEFRICPSCKSSRTRTFPIFHHMICANVGPAYDFLVRDEGALCPKCNRFLRDAGNDWEIVGDCMICEDCAAEIHL